VLWLIVALSERACPNVVLSERACTNSSFVVDCCHTGY